MGVYPDRGEAHAGTVCQDGHILYRPFLSFCLPWCAGQSRQASRQTVLVMFIGGVTFAEISALRFLSTQPHIHCDFVVATTKLINGTTLLESLSDEAVRRLAAASVTV